MIEIQSFLITTAFTEDCADILNKLLIPGYFVVYFFAGIPYICYQSFDFERSSNAFSSVLKVHVRQNLFMDLSIVVDSKWKQ